MELELELELGEEVEVGEAVAIENASGALDGVEQGNDRWSCLICWLFSDCCWDFGGGGCCCSCCALI